MTEWSAPPSATLRILVVDDDPLLQESAKANLAADDVRILLADDGVEALEVVARERVDVMLLDIELPRMNGFDVLDELRADPATRDLPVIMITGRKDVLSIDRAFELGARSFAVKPLNWVLLERQLRLMTCSPATEAGSDELVGLARDQARLHRRA